jgi:hypothetical protein
MNWVTSGAFRFAPFSRRGRLALGSVNPRTWGHDAIISLCAEIP